MDGTRPPYIGFDGMSELQQRLPDADLWFTSGTYAGANYVPQAGSPALSGASFTDGLLSTWFEKTTFVGAFPTNDNWLRGWTEFDPQNANY